MVGTGVLTESDLASRDQLASARSAPWNVHHRRIIAQQDSSNGWDYISRDPWTHIHPNVRASTIMTQEWLAARHRNRCALHCAPNRRGV